MIFPSPLENKYISVILSIHSLIKFVLLESSNLILPFLELETATEKIRYLQNIKDQVTGTFLEIIAQSLDFVENPGTITERYEAIILYLMTVEKYEKSRLR